MLVTHSCGSFVLGDASCYADSSPRGGPHSGELKLPAKINVNGVEVEPSDDCSPRNSLHVNLTNVPGLPS